MPPFSGDYRLLGPTGLSADELLQRSPSSHAAGESVGQAPRGNAGGEKLAEPRVGRARSRFQIELAEYGEGILVLAGYRLVCLEAFRYGRLQLGTASVTLLHRHGNNGDVPVLIADGKLGAALGGVAADGDTHGMALAENQR